MKKDIPDLKVEDLAIVIAPREEGEDEQLWDTFILNLKEESIQNVMITSCGYGELEGQPVKTSILRHFFEEITPLSIHQVEPILREAFKLTNEYWVSFTYEGQMYDKKYIFVEGSLEPINFTLIPFINRKGVMIR